MQPAEDFQAEALLEAGFRLSKRKSLSQLTTAIVATEAGLSSVRFFDTYPDLSTFLIDLYRQRFVIPVRQVVKAILADMPPGLERTKKAARAYLDFCLKHRGLRQWTIEARIWPEFNAAYMRANEEFQILAGPELQPRGFVDTASAARLFASIVYEITTAEVFEGHENPGMRQALWKLLSFEDRPVLRFPARARGTGTSSSLTTQTTRQRLLHAGEELLGDTGDPTALKLERLLARANTDKDSFISSFGDLKNFKLALIQTWTEKFMANCLAATEGLPPGTERLHAFMASAWDYNLNEQRGKRLLMKAMLVTEPELRERILSRVQGFTRMVATEFQTLGVTSPQPMARLFVAASTELVEAEEHAKAAIPRLRETFWQLFDPLTTGMQARSGQARQPRLTEESAQTSFLTMQIGKAPRRGRKRRLTTEAKSAIRQRLVEAGDRLLWGGTRPDALTPGRLTLVAGVNAGEFKAIYPEHSDYLLDLLTFLLDGIRDIVLEITSHLAPGVSRMWRGVEIYLDGRLDRPVMHELARLLMGHAGAARLSQSRARIFARIFAAEFDSAGWSDSEACGHLMVALVNETVLAEYEAGRRLPEYRETLEAFLNRGAVA